MATKKKRSFLQRIMGVDIEEENRIDIEHNTLDEEAQTQMNNPAGSPMEPPMDNVQQQPPQFQPREEEGRGMTPPAPQMNAPQMDQKNISGGPEGDEEGGWVADQEGQLTIDVYQTDTEIVIKSTIAGVKPEDLDIQINNDMVTIRGERRHEDEIRDEDYYYQECYWGSFSRSIILPVDVQANKAEAIMKNGILTLRLPKAETAKARKIQVRGY